MGKWYDVKVNIDMCLEYEASFKTLAEAEKDVERLMQETDEYKQANPEMSDAVFTLFLVECDEWDEQVLVKKYI